MDVQRRETPRIGGQKILTKWWIKMSEDANKPKPLPIECRHAIYSRSSDGVNDIHLIKEQVHLPDGTKKPNVRIVRNYPRPFYIERKGSRDYKEFKECREKEFLIRYESTQTKLTESVATALGMTYFRGSLRTLCAKEPYVYGVDINASSIIKHAYQKKWDVQTYYSVAGFDTETDVVHGHGEIMMSTLAFENKVFTVIQKAFIHNQLDPINRIRKLADQYIGHVIKKRNIEIEILIVDKEIDIVRETLKKAHAWSPDFISIWNIKFDMDKMLAACERANVNPADIFCDPKVPPEFRSFKWKKGTAKKETASGKVINYKPSQQWHSVICPSSFRWVDGMCVFRQVRAGAPEEPAYSLDYMLKKYKLGGKLEFEKADHITNKLDWHKYMQKHYPLEYVVYNQWDSISMMELDEKTLDIRLALPSFSGTTDLENFNSQPRRTMNELHWFFDEEGYVTGATSSDMLLEGDDDVVDPEGWIVMLPSHLVADNGIKIIKEHPDMATNIRLGTADLDIAGAYPTNESCANVSKATTKKEVTGIEGVTEEESKLQTINFSGGETNALEFCQVMCNMPTIDQLHEAFLKEMEMTA